MLPTPPTPDELRRRIWLSVVLLAAAGGAMSVVAIEPMASLSADFTHHLCCLEPHGYPSPTGFWVQDLVGAGLTAVLFGLALAQAIDAPEARRVGARAFWLCLGWACLNGVAVAMAHAVIDSWVLADELGRPIDDLPDGGPLLLGAISGLCPGVPVSLGIGAVYGLAGRETAPRLRRLLDRPSLDGPARAYRAVGMTIFGGGLLASMVAWLLASTAPDGLFAGLPVVAFTVTGLGLALAAAAGLHQRRTVRDRIDRDRIDRDPHDWTRVRLDALPSLPRELVRTHADVPEPPTHVVCRVIHTGDSAYRDSVTLLPWAYD